MKHCSLFGAGIWPFLLVPLLMLCVVLYFTWHSIEQTIESDANQSLANLNTDGGLSWAKVESFNRGREVLLAGTAPNHESVNKAKKIVLSSQGVNSVSFIGSVYTPDPARLVIHFNNKQILLTGTLNGQDAIDNIVLIAGNSFEPRKIINKLNILGLVDDLLITTDLLSSIGNLESGSQVTIQNNEVILNGKIENDDQLIKLLSNLKSVYKGNIDNQLSALEPALQCSNLIKKILESEKINFDTGVATITNHSYTALSKIIKAMRICPDTYFEISGHTDSTGAADLNVKLSESRAQAVLDHLIDKGLDKKRFTAKGYGDSQPFSDKQSLQDNAANRRIEFKVNN